MRKWMLTICALAVPAQAHCDRSTADLLGFLLPYASANFAGIRAGVSAPSDPQDNVGPQYHLTPAAEQFCPNVFILEDTPAHDKHAEFWEVKFDASQTGSGDDVALSLIKTLSPELKAAGYQDKPYINDGDDPNTYNMEWDGPSDTWVTVDTFHEDDKPDKTFYEIRVAHDVK
jgi:hypothetical protein